MGGKVALCLEQVTKLLRLPFPNLQDQCIELLVFLNGASGSWGQCLGKDDLFT